MESIESSSSADDRHQPSASFTIVALYQFLVHNNKDSAREQRNQLETFLRPFMTRGMLILAPEGINGTISFPSQHTETIMNELFRHYPKLQTRLSYHTEQVFLRLKVRVKTEIVTAGVDAACSDPTKQVGTYVNAGNDWDALLKDPNCLVVDTRNEYEYQIGTFHNAINPHTQSFVEFATWMHDHLEEMKQYNKVAFFCTGGIRCEKATAYCMHLLQDSPREVYHLKGGILSYLDTVAEEQSLFQGECYVFDRRTAVQHGLKPSASYLPCHACRTPLNPQDRMHADYVDGVSCHLCVESRQTHRERYESRQKQMEIQETHLYDRKERKLQRQIQYVTGKKSNATSLGAVGE